MALMVYNTNIMSEVGLAKSHPYGKVTAQLRVLPFLFAATKIVSENVSPLATSATVAFRPQLKLSVVGKDVVSVAVRVKTILPPVCEVLARSMPDPSTGSIGLKEPVCGSRNPGIPGVIVLVEF